MIDTVQASIKQQFERFVLPLGNYVTRARFLLFLTVLPGFIAIWSMAGWFLHNPLLIQISPTFTPMQFNTALCVLLTSIAAVNYWANRPLKTYVCSFSVLVIAGITLLQYVLGQNLGIDELFMEAYLTTNTAYPGRMATSTGSCFLLINVSLLLGSSQWRGQKTNLISLCISTAVVGIALISLAGYAADLTTAYAWGFTEMAVHTASAFALLGTGITLNTFLYKIDMARSQVFQRICLLVFGVTAIALTALALQAEVVKRFDSLVQMNVKGLQRELEQQQINRDGFLMSVAKNFTVVNSQDWAQSVGMFLNSRPSMIALQVAPADADAITISTGLRSVEMAELERFDEAAPLTAWTYDGLWYFKLYYPVRNQQGVSIGDLYVLFSLDRFFARTTSRMLSDQFAVTASIGGQVIGSSPPDSSAAATFYPNVLGTTLEVSLHAESSFVELQENSATAIILYLITFFVITLFGLQHFYFKIKKKNWEVKQLNSRLTESLNTMLDSVVISDEFGTIVQTNDATLACFDYEKEELIGKNIRCLVGLDHRDSHDSYISNFNSTGSAKFLNGKRMLVASSKNGDEIPVTVRISESQDSNGQRIFTAVIHDLTTLLAAESKQKETEAFLDTAMENSHISWAIVDLDGNFRSVNKAMQEWLGYQEDELVGQPLSAVYAEIEHTSINDDLSSLAGGSADSFTRERRYVSRDGRELWGLSTKSVVRLKNNSSPEYIVYQIIDISIQKALEDEMKTHIVALEKSNKELDQFAYVASHDLKSPLNAISKLASWIEEDCVDNLPEESQKHFQLIKGRIARLANLLDDLLAYSRVGRLDHEADYVKVHELSKNILDLIGAEHKFEINVPEISVFVPVVPFELVLRNLISNAVKHHDTGAGKLAVTVDVTDEGYRVRVEDDGPGIPESFREKALEMFQTLKSRDEKEGSGMGLAICKKAVEYYGGSFEIGDSKLGGTAMIMTWPYTHAKSTLLGVKDAQTIHPVSH